MADALARAYEIGAPDVVAEDFDGQVVVLNLANGHYYSVHGAGGALWTLVAAGTSINAVMASLSAQRPELVDDALRFVREIVGLGLVREAAPAGSVQRSRRAHHRRPRSRRGRRGRMAEAPSESLTAGPAAALQRSDSITIDSLAGYASGLLAAARAYDAGRLGRRHVAVPFMDIDLRFTSPSFADLGAAVDLDPDLRHGC
jgi:hypothetical protein